MFGANKNEKMKTSGEKNENEGLEEFLQEGVPDLKLDQENPPEGKVERPL